jgi:mono/diheme cytochrome c family protein
MYTIRRRERCLVKTSLAIALVLLASSASQAQTASPGTLTTNPVYEKKCAKCHGKTAEGRHFGGPSVVSRQATSMSADDLHNIISNGKGRMPKYAGKLTPEEIDTLVRQITASKK